MEYLNFMYNFLIRTEFWLFPDRCYLAIKRFAVEFALYLEQDWMLRVNRAINVSPVKSRYSATFRYVSAAN